MPGAESVVDVDVSGDGSIEGLTFAFDDDEPTDGASVMPPENDQDRLAYIEDVFNEKAHQTSSGVIFSARPEKR
jgi:hypothetical protein